MISVKFGRSEDFVNLIVFQDPTPNNTVESNSDATANVAEPNVEPVEPNVEPAAETSQDDTENLFMMQNAAEPEENDNNDPSGSGSM
ncbi:hypothetical protein DICVIV_07214 [Dictyocaulus viviparus]|uniref:Uncharacterized protein n=1 Tax=Dictyocaulus viviparus TaxID=29172 RepID=A0A0D8XQD5_DICVI|nr:hypothetical protein DICVIV_07214 [Dictyocaulus viviparus]